MHGKHGTHAFCLIVTLSNERLRYTFNVFSHWLKPCENRKIVCGFECTNILTNDFLNKLQTYSHIWEMFWGIWHRAWRLLPGRNIPVDYHLCQDIETDLMISCNQSISIFKWHDDVRTWNHIPHHWQFMRRNPSVIDGFSSQEAMSVDYFISCVSME